jgi:hypothetical protein
LAWGGCGLDSTGSGQRPVAGCCECGDEPSGSCATELVSYYCCVRCFTTKRRCCVVRTLASYFENPELKSQARDGCLD